MIVYEMRKVKSGNFYAAKTVMIRSLHFFPVRVLLNIKDMIKESLDCQRKTFDALKCYVRVARHTDILLSEQQIQNSAASD